MTWTFYTAQGQEKRGASSLVSMDSWHIIGDPGEPGFGAAPWIHYGGFTKIGFRKDPLGRVHLKGLLGVLGATPPSNTTIFTLPAGYRPTSTILMQTSHQNLGEARIDIYTDGRVQLLDSSSPVSQGTYITLDNLSFDTESVAEVLAGSRGPKGEPGYTEQHYQSNGWSGTPVSLTAATWAQLKPTTGSPYITPAGAFTENADGSVTVRDAGYYSATVMAAFVAIAGRVDVTIGGEGATTENYAVQQYASGDRGPILTATGVMVLAAGAKVWVSVRSTVTQANGVTFRHLTLDRLGAGPPGPQGVQGVKGDPGITDYAFSSGQTGPFSGTSVTWVQLPMATTPVVASPSYSTCFRQNADGTVTVLQAGWYDLAVHLQFPGTLAVDSEVIYGFWFTANDTLPATPTAIGAAMDMRTMGSISATGTPFGYLATGPVYINAGTRLGVGLYNYGATTSNFYVLGFRAARVGGGPQGIQGVTGTRGTKWWVSGLPYDNPEDIPPAALVAGDVFLYPDSADTFAYDGVFWGYGGPMQMGQARVPVVGQLPVTTVDGTTVDVQTTDMDVQGLRWRCVWDQNRSRWNVIDGKPLHVNNDTLFTVSSSPAYTTYQDTGISIDVPYPGTYDITTEGWLQTTAAVGNAALISWAPQGGIASDLYGAAVFTPVAVINSGTAQQTYRAGLNASQYNVRQALRSGATGPGAVTAQRRHLWLAPVFLDP